MQKLKVYLDTSVISHLMQKDVPEKMADTRQLWDMFKKSRENFPYSQTVDKLLQKFMPRSSFAYFWVQIQYYTYIF